MVSAGLFVNLNREVEEVVVWDMSCIAGYDVMRQTRDR